MLWTIAKFGSHAGQQRRLRKAIRRGTPGLFACSLIMADASFRCAAAWFNARNLCGRDAAEHPQYFDRGC